MARGVAGGERHLTRRLKRFVRGLWRPALALVGGLLAGPALPRSNVWLAIFVSVALIHLAIRGRGFWSGFRLGFIAGAAFYGSQSVWMTTYLGPVPWGALTVLEAFIFGVGLAIASQIWRYLSQNRSKFGAWYPSVVVFALSGVWVAREYVAGHYPYGGYQWSRLGQAVANTQLAQLAYWGGISLVSWSVAAIAIGVLIWIDLKPWRRHDAKHYWPTTLAALLPAVAVLALANITPLVSSAGDGKTIRVLAIQGNANAGLFANPEPGSILNKHLAETNRYLAANGNNFDLMVWPENASDLNPLANPLAEAQLRALVARTGKPLLVGAITERNGKIYNSGLLYRPDTMRVDQYDKFRPVPFGEYVPDRPLFHALAPKLIDLIYRDYTPGTRVGTFNVAGTRIGDLICFEIAIDEVTHQLVQNGATVLVSEANNSDFGHTDEAFQQESLVRLQAIAAGRSYVHDSTVATTQIVDPQGKILANTKAFTPQYAVADVPLSTQLTPAMRFFGWTDKLSLLGVALAIVALILRWALRFASAKSKKTKLGSTQSDRKATLNTLVIMPTYNESESIRGIAGGLLETVKNVDLLIVDDNSPDGTGQIADEMAAANPRVHVLHRTEKNGLGPAYLAGFAWGFEKGYEFLVEMDADGSHRAEDLITMLAAAPNYDLVIGSRWVKGGKVVNWPLSRQIISRTGNTYARFMLRAGIHDITAGFRVFRASFLKSLDLGAIASAGYSFQVEMAWRCFKANARIHEVPITFVERAHGSSKMSQKIVLEALWRVTKWGFERR